MVLIAATAAAPAAAEPQVPPGAGTDGLSAEVTLVTGDKVTVNGDAVHVQRAPGRENLRFRTYRDVHGHLHVVPLDVQPRLNSGELDERLFDVSLLAGAAPDQPRGVRQQVAESYDLKLTFLDHDGRPAPNYHFRFVDNARQEEHSGYDPSGTVTVRLPKGTFYFEANIDTPGATPTTRGRLTSAAEPAFAVTSDTELVIDARQATQPAISVDRQEAAEVVSEAGLSSITDWGGEVGARFLIDTFDGFYVRPSTTSRPQFSWYAQTVLARPDGTGRFSGSPYQYHARVVEHGGVPANVRRTLPDNEFAVIDTVTHARVPGSQVNRNYGASGPAPFKLREYYTPDVEWWPSTGESTAAGNGYQTDASARVYRRGQTGVEHLNTAVFGPAFPFGPANYRPAGRRGDLLRLQVPMFSDSSGLRMGDSPHTGRTTLSRDGELLGEAASAGGYLSTEAPAASTRFQLHAEGARDSVTARVIADWTFTSEHVPGDELELVPLLAVRFAPELDEHNRGRAGRALTFPITVQRNGTAGNVTDVRAPAVQVSYDEGATWHGVKPLRIGTRWLVTLWHPANAKSVSLKANTGDETGEVEQTIIRAYYLK
ncbi:hypothetical protein [Lentzea sp. NPDC051838]|uniref:hypothetical protein n=1 Tax=Lentzea sp. NPDC051838 TaxID=3154849 RepID=UPI00342DF016